MVLFLLTVFVFPMSRKHGPAKAGAGTRRRRAAEAPARAAASPALAGGGATAAVASGDEARRRCKMVRREADHARPLVVLERLGAVLCARVGADARGAHASAARRTSQRAPAGAGGPRPERGVGVPEAGG